MWGLPPPFTRPYPCSLLPPAPDGPWRACILHHPVQAVAARSDVLQQLEDSRFKVRCRRRRRCRWAAVAAHAGGTATCLVCFSPPPHTHALLKHGGMPCHFGLFAALRPGCLFSRRPHACRPPGLGPQAFQHEREVAELRGALGRTREEAAALKLQLAAARGARPGGRGEARHGTAAFFSGPCPTDARLQASWGLVVGG